jgi:hypothetical protein
MSGDTTTLQGNDISFTPTGTIQRAIQEQNQIGWSNFYRGRISLEWVTAQQQQYEKQYKTKMDTEQWATSIISTIWHGFLELWEARKDDQHGRDKIEQQAKEKKNTTKQNKNIIREHGAMRSRGPKILQKSCRTLGTSNEQKHKRLAKHGQKKYRNKQGTSNKTSKETTASS